jgi:hypothetical protein
MATPSPICVVSDNGGAYGPTTNGVNVGAGDPIAVQLASAAGVAAWTLTCTGVDDLSVAPTITVSGTGNNTRNFAAGSAGSTFVFQSQVQDGQGNPYTTTFGIYVTTSGGNRVIAVNERFEGNATFGWIATLNQMIRSGGGGGGGGGGPTLLATIYATPGSPLARAAAWMCQPVDTQAAPCGFTVPTTAQVGDRMEALDAGRSWGTHAFTFNGGSHLVEDPFSQQTALASTWVSPAGFSDVGATWVLITDTNIGTYWKAL